MGAEIPRLFAGRDREGSDRGPRINQTIYLSGIDSKTLYEQFVSPSGSFRNAERRRVQLRLVYG